MIQELKGKIGLISPRNASAWQPGVIYSASGSGGEYQKMAPSAIDMIVTCIPLEEVTESGLIKMGGYIEEASALLAREKVDVIAFGCTTGSLIKGIGYDREIINRIESHIGIPAITTVTAIINSLESLKVKRIAVATPYTDEVNRLERSFLEKSGLEITSMKGLGLAETHKITDVPAERVYRLVKQILTKDAEAVLISCTGLRVVEIIQPLEMETKRPVVTSNQVTLWAALRKINITDKISGFGRLFYT